MTKHEPLVHSLNQLSAYKRHMTSTRYYEDVEPLPQQLIDYEVDNWEDDAEVAYVDD